MNDAIIYISLLLIIIAAILFIPAFMTERAAVRVIRIFQEHRAHSIWNAMTAEELGLRPRGLADRLLKPLRDYKPMALKALMSIGIIRKTGNGKLYLSTKGLADFCSRADNHMKVCSLA